MYNIAMTQEQIKSFRESIYFSTIQDYLFDKIADLSNVDDLIRLSDKRAGEQVKARALAKKKLIEILTPFMEYTERAEYTNEELNNAKSKFGF